MPNTASSPLPIAVQDAIYSSRNPTRRWLHQIRRDWINEKIARAGREGRAGRALEVGAGSGQYTRVLMSRFSRLTVLDIELAYLHRARQVAGEAQADSPPPGPAVVLDCCQGDLLRAPFSAASFDLILCSEVIEHLPPSRSAARSLYELLRPGGVLILTTPQKYSLLEGVARLALAPPLIGLTRLIYREPVQDMGHTNLMRRPQLQAELAAAGFETIETACFGLYLPLIAEFGGRIGQRLIARLDAWCQRGPLASLLWTQAYLCRRPVMSSPATQVSATGRAPRISSTNA